MRGLPPLVGDRARILVLGSFPSVASLAAEEYYAYDRNHFWLLISAVLGEPLPAKWAEKTALLLDHGIAVWDVIAECERLGSLDQAIRNANPNPIPGFLAGHPGIVRVVFNGSKAADTFTRHFVPGAQIPLAPSPPIPWDPETTTGAVAGAFPGAGCEHKVGREHGIGLVRVPSSSPVPSRVFKTAADKMDAWQAAFRV